MKGYIKQRKATGANPENALQFSNLDNICCGDSLGAVACRFECTIDVTSVTAVSLIRIAGTTHTLDASYAVGYASGREALLQNIRDLIEELGYTSADAVSGELDGNNWTISIDYSTLEFNWLQTSANEFLPTLCKVIGTADANCCDAAVAIEVDDTDVIFTFTSCQTITNVTINDGGGNVYNGDLSAGSSGDATVSAAGVVTLDGSAATGQNWNGEVTFTVTITTSGCTAVTKTITIGLVPS